MQRHHRHLYQHNLRSSNQAAHSQRHRGHSHHKTSWKDPTQWTMMALIVLAASVVGLSLGLGIASMIEQHWIADMQREDAFKISDFLRQGPPQPLRRGALPPLLQENNNNNTACVPSAMDKQAMVWKHLWRTWKVRTALELQHEECQCWMTMWWEWRTTRTTRNQDGPDKALCVYTQTSSSVQRLPMNNARKIQHDYSRGPYWWPAEMKVVDVVWAVDYFALPHNDNKWWAYEDHLLATLCSAVLVVVPRDTSWTTAPPCGGRLRYNATLTQQLQHWVGGKDQAMHVYLNLDNAKLAPHLDLSRASSVTSSDRGVVEEDRFWKEFVQSRQSRNNSAADDKQRKKNKNKAGPEKGNKRHTQRAALPRAKNETSQRKRNVNSAQQKNKTNKDTRNNNTKVTPDYQPDPLPPSGMTKEAFFNLVIREARKPIPQAVQDDIFHRQPSNDTMEPVISVVVWPVVTYGFHTAEHSLIEENGIQESPYLTWESNISDFRDDPYLVWVADAGWGWTYKSWCHELAKAIQQAQAERFANNKTLRWPIFIVDFTDGAVNQRCRQVEQLVGGSMVRYNTRALANGRQWSDTLQWVRTGSRLVTPSSNNNNNNNNKTFSYRHTPLIVRTDTVQALQEELLHLSNDTKQPANPLELKRPVDVSHFWPANEEGKTMLHGTAHAKLRRRVSQIVQTLAAQHNLTAAVGLQGDGGPKGRRQVQSAYLRGLLRTKVLVISQRDLWEDSYRLMEGLISGACVLTDFMHGLPAGLRNGTSVVVYRSAQELQHLILEYVQHPETCRRIAQQGRQVALSRHRSWHRMEEIVFGRILSNNGT